jgi:hypothetical protein
MILLTVEVRDTQTKTEPMKNRMHAAIMSHSGNGFDLVARSVMTAEYAERWS